MTDFHLCKFGWALYDAWCELCDAKAPMAELAAAFDAYLAHKEECEECGYDKERR